MNLTAEQIINGSKLIAEFCNERAGTGGCYYLPQFGHYFNLYGGGIEYEDCFRASELQYHKSWDWLMFVIEKIEKLPITDNGAICVSIENKCCRIYLDDWGAYTDIAIVSTKDSKLEAAFKSVVKFIEWYKRRKNEAER